MTKTPGLALAALLALACQTEDLGPTRTTVPAIASTPDAFQGELVVVSGTIDQVWQGAGFTLTAGDYSLLVVVPEEVVRPGLDADDWTRGRVVQVTGTVRRYDEALAEAVPGTEVLVPGRPSDPAVVAQEVLVTPPSRPVAIEPAPRVGEPDPTIPPARPRVEEAPVRTREPPARPPPPRDPPRVPAAEPEPEAVERPPEVDPVDPPPRPPPVDAARFDIRVERVLDDDVYLARLPDGRELLIRIAEDPVIDLSAGQRLTIEGTVEPLPDTATLRERWGLPDPAIESIRHHPTYLRGSRISGVPAAPPDS